MENKKSIIVVNSVTMIRVVGTFIMPFLSKILSPGGLVIYIACLLLTDALDGILARRLNACTIFGSLLDTAADKLLGISCLAILASKYPIMLLPIITEILIIIINFRGGLKGASVESSILGKIKTWLLGIVTVVCFCTVYAENMIQMISKDTSLGMKIIEIFNKLNEDPSGAMNSLAFVALGMGAMVACDYYLRIKHDIKKAKESGTIPKNIKIKFDKDLIKVLFSEKYYKETKNIPLIKKIGKVVK